VGLLFLLKCSTTRDASWSDVLKKNSYEIVVANVQGGSDFQTSLDEIRDLLTSNIDVCVVGISAEDDEQDAFRDSAGVSLRLSLGRRDEAGGRVLGKIAYPETLI
jgi:hypothetical protein